ncbi:MAG: hypothetical protein NVSMB6_04270 [Burkholderiaceae bacterium]
MRLWCTLSHMANDTDIELCGPFSVRDCSGNARDIEAIRIFDEGYGIIDVYVHMAVSMEDDRLYEDTVLIGQIMARLHQLGYVGPDFGHGDLGLQDDKLIVLEAPEAFNAFAATRGWKNLADEFAEDEPEAAFDSGASSGPTSALLDALMRKFKAS